MALSLWEEARDQFLNDLKTRGVDKPTIDSFLQEKASPDDAKRSALSLQADSDKKYGKIEVGGKAIPKKWIARIMDNIGRFVAIGDYAMKGAPETVGLAWFAVKQILNAVQNNYKLYGFFGGSLTSITEMLVLIRTYDKLYDERKKAHWQASDIVGELFSQIRNVYAAILDFSFSVKKHIKGGKMAKVGHAIKDMFGADLPEFEEKMGAIQALKTKILESSQGAFQEKTFERLQDVSGSLSNVTGTLSFLSEAVQSSLQGTEEMKQLLEETLKSTKFKSIYDLALQDFEKNKKTLNPLPDSSASYQAHLRQLEEGTCTWVFELDEYTAWRTSTADKILCIKGEAGSGKSVLLASTIHQLEVDLSEDLDYTVQYLFCDDHKAGDDPSQALTRIQNTLIYQLYELAQTDEKDAILLQKCNDVFANPKLKKAQSSLPGSGKDGPAARLKKDETGPDVVEVYSSLVRALDKKVVLVIDAADSIPDSDQGDFISALQELAALDWLPLQILLSCPATGTIFKRVIDEGIPQISMDAHNSADIDLIVTRGLSEMAGWSQSERDEAHQKVLQKTGSIFKYVVQVAMPFLSQPFQRPISNRLRELPDNMNETYSQHLRQLAPNYLGLLKTALTWTLLAESPVTVPEIMDAYTGVFTAPGEEGDPEEYVENDNFKLQANQIRDASGPFLDVVDDGTRYVVSLKDSAAIHNFCFASPDETDHEKAHEVEDNREVCARCKTELNPSRALSLTLKGAHLEVATTCLRHLNSSLFKSRYLTNSDSESVSGPGSKSDSDSSSESGSEAGSETTETATEPKPAHDEEKETSAGDEKTVNEEKETNGEINKPEEKEGEDKPQTAEEADDDESQDSEDRSDEELARVDDDNTYETGEDWQDESLRYEIRSWFYHAREAERLWSPAAREDSEEWKAFISELTKFVNNTEVFSLWKAAQLYEHEQDWEPILVGAYYGLTSLVEILLAQGADVKAMNSAGLMPLHLASESSHPLDMLKLLLAHGAEPNFETDDSEIPAFHYWIIYSQNPECIELLIRHGASCSLIGQTGMNVMHYYASYGFNPLILGLLLDNEDEKNRADINIEDNIGETPLHKLMARTEVPDDMLQVFVDRGANVNAEDKDGERPLYETAWYGENAAIARIIDHVTNVDDENKHGRTALHVAAWNAHVDTVKLLLRHGANPNKPDKHGRTPFFFACLCWSSRTDSAEETAQVLLDKLIEDGYKIDEINKITKRHRTPLREAAAHGFTKIVETILGLIEADRPKTVNARDTIKGKTALHCAAVHGHADVVKSLLLNGADVSLKTGPEGDDKTALELAHDQWAVNGSAQQEATLAAIIDYDSSGAAHNKDLLATAAINGSVTILEKLLDAKADMNEPDQYGWTPLLLARQFQRTEAVAFLARRVAQIGMKPTRWINTRSSPGTTISENGLQLTHTAERECVFADHPVPAGLSRYYYEITVSAYPGNESPNPILGLGFCTSSAHHLLFPGWATPQAPNSHSWAYHGDDGKFYSSPKGAAIGGAETYGPGDTIGCGVNYEEGKVFFTKNGKLINDLAFENVSGRLFPVLGFKDSIVVETNFGNDVKDKPLSWSEDEYGTDAAPVVNGHKD